MQEVDERFEKILHDIKSVKIQGAENVAKAGMNAFLLKSDRSSVKKILATRPTEPLLQNSVKILLKAKDKKNTIKCLLREIEKSHRNIASRGARLIKNEMNVYSHCHSSTVIDILKFAKQKHKKKFTVYTSEVEPLLQGRKTAVELAKLKIKVIVFPDLAAEHALKKCDIFLFGADAFTKKYVHNKIGTSALVRTAKLYHIPRYSCGVSMKFSRKVKIEKRTGREVWDERNKNITIENFAFDKTKIKDLNGIISELGILPPKQFVRMAKEKIKNLSYI